MGRVKGLTLVLGGARSGKSRYAEKLAADYGSVTYIATADPIDAGMKERIAAHLDRRPDSWQTLELTENNLVEALGRTEAEAVLLDSLTLYVSRVMENERQPMDHIRQVVSTAGRFESDMIIVSDEVGLGVVPMTEAGRTFRDLLGWTNQQFAAVSDYVYLVIAGVALPVKQKGTAEWR